MRASTLVTALFATTATVATAAAAGCQKGIASAPYIGAADMRAIDRAALRLPAERPGKLRISIGAPVSKSVQRKPVPAAVAKALPQYRGNGYTAFRAGERLLIVDRRDVLTYVLPIGHPTKPGNCP